MPVDSDHEKSFQMGARERLATSVVQVIFKILFKIDFGNFHEFFDQSEQALQVCLFICYFFFQGGRSKNLLLAELGQELAAQRDSLNKRLQGN